MTQAEQANAAETARADFIETVGVIAQSEGLPRIAGRVLAMLLYDGERVSFGQLADALQVSRGSISSSVRMLESQQLIKRVAKPGDRQDYFQLADDAYAAMTKFALAGTRRSQAEIDDTIEKLPEEAQDVRARLEAFASFYNAISAALEDAIPRVTKPKT